MDDETAIFDQFPLPQRLVMRLSHRYGKLAQITDVIAAQQAKADQANALVAKWQGEYRNELHEIAEDDRALRDFYSAQEAPTDG